MVRPRSTRSASLAAAASPAHSSKLFSAGELNVTLYRIPVLVALPPDNQTLLAFAEARLPCVRSCGNRAEWGDSSPKHIAFRRSTKTWAARAVLSGRAATHVDVAGTEHRAWQQ